MFGGKPLTGYGLQWATLGSWIHAVSYIRNLCAHHSRLWNRDFTITPTFADHPSFGVTDNTRFYAQAIVLNYFMRRIAPNTRWIERLLRFIKSYPYIDPKAMASPRASITEARRKLPWASPGGSRTFTTTRFDLSKFTSLLSAGPHCLWGSLPHVTFRRTRQPPPSPQLHPHVPSRIQP